MAPHDPPVRVINTHPEYDFVDRFAGHTYTIKSGEETIIPYDAMCLWLGNPDAVDVDGRRRFRRDEFRRLRVRYGSYDSADMWEEVKPQLSCKTIDGQSITTIVDDPEGKHITPAVQSRNERDQLIARMEQMQRAMELMQAQLNEQTTSGQAERDTPPPPTPGPSNAPVPPINIEQSEEPQEGEAATPDGPTSVRISS